MAEYGVIYSKLLYKREPFHIYSKLLYNVGAHNAAFSINIIIIIYTQITTPINIY